MNRFRTNFTTHKITNWTLVFHFSLKTSDSRKIPGGEKQNQEKKKGKTFVGCYSLNFLQKWSPKLDSTV